MMRLVSKVLFAALTLGLCGAAAAQGAPSAGAAAPPGAQPVAAADRSWAVSASAGVVFPGTVTINDTDVDTDTGFLLKGAADFFVAPRISMGVFIERMAISASDFDADATVLSLGGTIIGRFGPPSAGHFRAGLGLSYEMESVDVPGSDDATGLGLRAFLGYAHPAGQVSWFGQVGLAGSPSGGNDEDDVTYGPMFTLSVGAEFGK